MRYFKTLTSNGKPITIHAISTGYVAVKRRFRDARYKGFPALLDFVLDRKFTEWMPIWVWVIQHEEGIFMVDTGENSRINDKDYFKPAGRFENWLNTSQFKFKVEREEEIDAQLIDLNISPDEVKTVILTHRHLDHVDGISHFPNSQFLVHRVENEKPYGDLPHLYPIWFNPTLVDLDESFYNFPNAKKITQSGDIWIIDTAGHTYGHVSVAIKTDDGILFLAGDVSYNQDQLLQDRHAGADITPKKSALAYQRIKALAKKEKLVYLPSHDAKAGKRLENLSYLY